MFFVATRATLNISSTAFDKSRIVVARNGVLTIRNADRKPYVLTIGATPLTVRAKSSASLRLPQKGTFSIVCAKWPSLVATVVVK
ncbi:MAG: hypothetical protein EBZ54_01785 [Actinobacteria bacterium]|nr:hypothetical protein [Actinomycetota bacterium]